MTVKSKCFLLFFGLLLASANGGHEYERSTYLRESVDPPCTCPYSCVTTNECAIRHADKGTEEVLFRCDGKGKVCCPPLRTVSSRTSIATDLERPQPNEYVYNVDCPDNRNTNKINKNSSATTYTEPKQEEQEHFSAPGEFNAQIDNSGKQPNIYGSREPVGTQIISTTARQTATTQPTYAGELYEHIGNNGKEPNIYESRKPVETQIISTTTRRTIVTQPAYAGELNENLGNYGKEPNIYEPRKPVGTQIISTTTRRTIVTQPAYAGELNENLGNYGKEPNIYEPRKPVGTQIISTTTRRTIITQPAYAGNLSVNIVDNVKQPHVYESRRPVGTQILNTTTRKTFVQDIYTKPQPSTTTPSPQARPLGLQNSKVPLSSHRNFDLLPKEPDCGINHFANRISEGEEVSLGEYPWMALTGVRDKYGNFRWNCGGTLINERYVLTAAHCLVVDNRSVEYVRLGEHNLTNETDCAADICLEKVEDVAIAEVIPHENWNTTTIKNDIALIRLSRNPLILGKSNIYPICLPLEVEKLNMTATTKYEIAGWGKTDWNADQGSDVLRKASISGVSREECNICKGKKKQQYCPITDSQLCVQGYKSVDVCKGDSGGPLMVVRLNIYQVGITSFKGSEYCGAENIPSIFTKVESYLPWILDNIRQ